MLDEYSDIAEKLKLENPRFAKVVDKHAQLDQQIADIDEGRGHMESSELDKLKKEKLSLKDEAYRLVMEYKKANNL